jgi:hypothetical protein
MMLFCLWLLVLVLALPVSGQAAVYYIAPSGNDGFPCTEAQPCKSINKGRSMLGPGDTLYFLGGVYNDAFNINTY